MKSFATEVIADGSGKWCGNALRFATREEAQASGENLALRWTMVRQTRTVESDDPVNYKLVDGVLHDVEPEIEMTDGEEEAWQALSSMTL